MIINYLYDNFFDLQADHGVQQQDPKVQKLITLKSRLGLNLKSDAAQKIMASVDCKGNCKFGKKLQNLKKPLLGKDGHDMQPHRNPNLFGGDGHDLKPHGKSNLIGGDGHDLKPHRKSNLIGGDDHDLKPHKQQILIGGDGHDLKPHGKSNLIGGDGHDLKPHGKSNLIGGDGHDLNHGNFNPLGGGLLLNGSPMLNGDVGDLCQWVIFQQFQGTFNRLYMSKQGE